MGSGQTLYSLMIYSRRSVQRRVEDDGYGQEGNEAERVSSRRVHLSNYSSYSLNLQFDLLIRYPLVLYFTCFEL